MPALGTRHVAIVGSGPAGYTAGIYAARAGLAPVLFEGIELGGSLMTTGEVENFPGFPEGVGGPELMALMRAQAQAVGVELVTEDVEEIHLEPGANTLRSASGETTARALVLAMGARTRSLGVAGEDWAWGNGLSTCATCDGAFFKNRSVVVVGGGDAAVEEALTLSRIASQVTLIHRRDAFRASQMLLDRLESTAVRIETGKTVQEILGPDKVTGVLVRDEGTGQREPLPTDGLFVAIGQDPRSDLIAGQVETTASGHVRVFEGTMTSAAGVFACGDLVDHVYRQAVTSAASGCQAVLDAQRWLVESRAHDN